MNDEIPPRLRYAMVGGGHGAFIGAVHRHAIALDGLAELAAGALSATPEKALASGRALGLTEDNNHPSWQALLDAELKRPPAERIDRTCAAAVFRFQQGLPLTQAESGYLRNGCATKR